jgi:hypothetical protein
MLHPRNIARFVASDKRDDSAPAIPESSDDLTLGVVFGTVAGYGGDRHEAAAGELTRHPVDMIGPDFKPCREV